MKRLKFIICLIALPYILISQSKHDNTWVLGYGPATIAPNGLIQGGTEINFNNNPPNLDWVSLPTKFVIAVISDSSGNLVAYSDGCRVSNGNHEIMVNGDTITAGEIYNLFCKGVAYPLYQAPILLPAPEKQSKYYLIQIKFEDISWTAYQLLWSLIDVEMENGRGAVVQKDQIICEDSLLGFYITATRHANGRDWWVVAPRQGNVGFNVSLLSPEGISYKGIQQFDSDSLYTLICCGQTAFSPDGSKYFMHLPTYGVFILDFNRCTGGFSNPKFIDQAFNQSGSGGVAVAPGGRYLYVPSGYRVFQYDLMATDIAASRLTVAEYDGYESPFPTTFFQAMLAPDGKIYISSPNGNNILHVINQPDSTGLACNLVQHGLTLPALAGFFIPNFPNFRLAALAGSPCDTIRPDTTITTFVKPGEIEQAPSVRSWPNPVTAEIRFERTPFIGNNSNSTLRIYDGAGKTIVVRKLNPQESNWKMDTTKWPAGLYFWEISTDAGIENRGRFQKI
ncbi:MAG: T9SS type A sorting domain-containing protein [Bacteroidota bacterium]